MSESNSEFDRAGLIELLEGDEELLAELVSLFIEDAPDLLARLSTALEAREAEDARRLAHSLKGVAANVGASRMQRAAVAIERLIEAGDLLEAERVCATLEGELDRFTASAARARST